MSIFDAAAIVLAVATFAFIIYPLFKQRPSQEGLAKDDKLLELSSRRDTTYSMLKELEFDFQSGILTEEDYRDLETRYKKKAISILRGVDELQEGTNVEDEIEKRVLQLRQTKGRFCPQCGTRYRVNDVFCASCGTDLSQGENVD